MARVNQLSDIDKKALEPLDDRQESFCQYYTIDFNGLQSALSAGYAKISARGQASTLLTRPNIVRRCAQLMAEKFDRVQITQDWVLLKLKQVVDRCMCAEEVMEWDHSEKKLLPTGFYTFDSKGAIAALALLGKQLGMFNSAAPQLPPTNPDTEKDLIFEAEKKAAALCQ